MVTIIATAEHMAENYRDHMLEFLDTHREDVGLHEYAGDLERTARTLQAMTSSDTSVQLSAFIRECRMGYTMVMLPDDIDALETAVGADQSHRVVVFRDNGTPVGVINQENLCW